MSVLSLMLCQCARDLRTALENDTGQDVWLVIEFQNSRAIKRVVPAGAILSVPQRIETMTRVSFASGHAQCSLSKEQIKRAVNGELFGRPLIKLRPCHS